MTQSSPSLLPAGLYDLLPPKAAHERHVSGRLLDVFEAFGYAQVAPPLMEFEASLLAGRWSSALSAQTYRVMDTESQQMMAFRPDITQQVGRIASVRMAEHARPLRLSYSGSTLRVKGEGRERARQWRQAGIELIGVEDAAADAEVIAVAAHSIVSLGVGGLVVDVNFPGLVKQLLQSSGVDEARQAEVLHAVECKDTGWLKAAGLFGYAAGLAALTDAAGEAEEGMRRLQALDLPEQARRQVAYVQAVIEAVKAFGLPLEITIDPVENKGFEYHAQVSFSLFSRESQSELGRGGRYSIGASHGREESATGVTLYVNTLMEAVPQQRPRPSIWVGKDVPLSQCLALQAQGYVVIRSFSNEGAEARAAGCTHVLVDGDPRAIAG